MKGSGLLVLWVLPLLCSGQAFVFSGGRVNECEDKCANTYSLHTTEQVANELKSCEQGCRFLSLLDAASFDPFTLDVNQTFKNCNNSCRSSYKEEKNAYGCKLGCGFQVPIVKNRRKMLSSPLDSFFGSSFPSLGGVAIPVFGDDGSDSSARHKEQKAGQTGQSGQSGQSGQTRSMLSPFSDLFGSSSSSSFGQMFDRMRNEMNRMVSRVMSGDDPSDLLDGTGGQGKLVVIRSGPGYHEEKTYHYGGGDAKNSEQDSNSLDKDMMSHANPLERFFDLPRDVELFDPSEANREFKKHEHENENGGRVFTVDLFGPLFGSSSSSSSSSAKPTRPRVLQPQSTVHGFDVDDGLILEEPRLPGEGLKSRHAVVMEQMCKSKSENMKWSDWVSCLHLQMGLPRWLTACTISLGIIFVIWLCLVIPQHAPKQRVVQQPKPLLTSGAFAAAKKQKLASELCTIDAPCSAYEKMDDLPPAYDDVANLHVAVPVAAPVHQPTASTTCETQSDQNGETEKKVRI